MTIALISFVLVYMLTNGAEREQVILSMLVTALVVAISVIRTGCARTRRTRSPGCSTLHPPLS